jgi:hypothetical protein
MQNLTVLPLEVVRVEEATPLSPADTIAIHELLNRVYLSEDSREREVLRQVVTENFVQIHSILDNSKDGSSLLTGLSTIRSFLMGFAIKLSILRLVLPGQFNLKQLVISLFSKSSQTIHRLHSNYLVSLDTEL